MINSIIMLCGRIGSGKTTYAKMLQREKKLVVLSCDDFVLAINDDLSKRHEIQEKISVQLFDLAKQIWRSGVSVILDFGFWYKEQRKNIKREFEKEGIKVELYYCKCDIDETNFRIIERNNKILQNEARGYIIDLKLKKELDDKFDEPDEDEAYVLVENMEIDEDITYKNKEKLIEEILNIKEFVIEQKCLCDNVVLYIRPLYIEKIYLLPNILNLLSEIVCSEFMKMNIKHIFAIESAILPCAAVVANKLGIPLCIIRKQNNYKHEKFEPQIFVPDNYIPEHAIVFDDALWTGKTLNYSLGLFEYLKIEIPHNFYFIFDFRNFMCEKDCASEKCKEYIKNRKVLINYRILVDKAFEMKKINLETYIETIKLFEL